MAGQERISADARAVDRLSLVVNGAARDAHGRTLALVLAELGYAGQKVATALNGTFVPEKARAATPLNPGDQIEIVAPRQGG